MLYDMNDIITLNWKKIHSFEPEPELRSEDRPYTHHEIAALLTKASPRDRAIILLMSLVKHCYCTVEISDFRRSTEASSITITI